MEFAQALLALWQRKNWLAVGLVAAVIAGVASTQLLKSTVYAAATTQLVVDSPRSALGNIDSSLDPLTARAGVFAQLMTTPPALSAIGQAARIPSREIAAQGPTNPGTAVAQPATPQSGTAAASRFKLVLTQDPAVPTVKIYAEAPTTRQAIALADGAVTGFGTYLRSLEAQGAIPAAQQVKVRPLGGAVGGVVDPSAGKKIAVLIAAVVFLAWCAIMLLVARTRGELATGRTRIPAAGGNGALNGDLSLPFDRRRYIAVAAELRHERSAADTQSDGETNHISAPNRIAAPAEWHSARNED